MDNMSQIYHICLTGVKNQQLLSCCLDLGWVEEARILQQIDAGLIELLAWKAGFNPSQPRVPAGRPDGGRWTRVGEGEDATTINDPPIEPVYIVESILAGLFGSRALSLAIEILRNIGKSPAEENNSTTMHGGMRSGQRGIGNQQIEEAISTAEKSGNVTTKIGKYGTPQKHYKGSNGVTVVVETTGRNAGKVITVWRH